MTDKQRQIIEALRARHPYHVTGSPHTYSEYNEAWQDAIDAVLDALKKEDEAIIIDRINAMCEQSLSPERFESWEDVKLWLQKTRNINRNEAE